MSSGSSICDSVVFAVSMLQGATLQVCVKDPSGAIIPGASVAAYSRATQQRNVVLTETTGCARFEQISAGKYDLSVEANGFATEQTEASFQGSADQSVDVQLRLGHTSETTVVTADRTNEEIDQTPASLSLFDQQDFLARQSPDLSDVLEQLPNVEMSGGPRASGQIPSIRGYIGPEIITLIDGARINFSNGLFSPIFVEPVLIGEGEVIRGTSSTTYGTGGMGGVLAIRTIRASDELEPRRDWGGQFSSGYDSGDTGQHYNGMLYGLMNSFDWLGDIGYRNFEDIRQGGGTELRPNDGHDYWGLLNLRLASNGKMAVPFGGRVLPGGIVSAQQSSS